MVGTGRGSCVSVYILRLNCDMACHNSDGVCKQTDISRSRTLQATLERKVRSPADWHLASPAGHGAPPAGHRLRGIACVAALFFLRPACASGKAGQGRLLSWMRPPDGARRGCRAPRGQLAAGMLGFLRAKVQPEGPRPIESLPSRVGMSRAPRCPGGASSEWSAGSSESPFGQSPLFSHQQQLGDPEPRSTELRTSIFPAGARGCACLCLLRQCAAARPEAFAHHRISPLLV